MGRRRARGMGDGVVRAAGKAAIHDDALRAARELEGQAARTGFRRLMDRRAGPDVGDEQRLAGLEPLVARMGRVVDRLAAHVVVGEQRRELVGRGYAHAVEMREGAVAVAEQAQHRQHAVDGVESASGRIDLAAREHLAQGQEIEEELDEQARIAARMAAVREDLAVELAGEEPGRAPNEPSSPSQQRPA